MRCWWSDHADGVDTRRSAILTETVSVHHTLHCRMRVHERLSGWGEGVKEWGSMHGEERVRVGRECVKE